jgi:hypothetical protein
LGEEDVNENFVARCESENRLSERNLPKYEESYTPKKSERENTVDDKTKAQSKSNKTQSHNKKVSSIGSNKGVSELKS